jgi:hypothetical protein
VKNSGAHYYEVRPRKDRRGVDPISEALPFGRLWYAEPDAIKAGKVIDGEIRRDEEQGEK